VPDSCINVGVIVVGQCNGIIQSEPQPTPVATVTDIFACCHKISASVKLFCTYDNTVISSCMSFFGFPSVTQSLLINVGVNFSLNLMHDFYELI